MTKGNELEGGPIDKGERGDKDELMLVIEVWRKVETNDKALRVTRAELTELLG